jgi:hypothetical protein
VKAQFALLASFGRSAVKGEFGECGGVMRVPSLFVWVACVSLVPFAAAADVIPPEVDACRDKKKGDVCALTPSGQGTCQDGQYCHLVYGKCDSGGGPCGTACDPALTCKSGIAPAADGGPNPTTKESGCTIGGIDARLVGPWILAGAVSALVLLLGRRRR